MISRSVFRVKQPPLPSQVAIKIDKSQPQNHSRHQIDLKRDIDSAVAIRDMSPQRFNQELADRASKFVRSFAKWGTNHPNDKKLNDADAKQRIDQVRLYSSQLVMEAVSTGKIPSWPTETETPHLRRVRRTDTAPYCAEAFKKFGFGHCHELESTAYVHLQEICPTGWPLQHCVIKGGDHTFVLVGHAPYQVACDPWAQLNLTMDELANEPLPIEAGGGTMADRIGPASEFILLDTRLL